MRRRDLLAAFAALGAAPAWADPLAIRERFRWARPGRERALFLGNSFTFEHDVPGTVARLAAGADRPFDAAMLAFGGAHLAATWARPGVRETVSGVGWDVVVVQDHSTAALLPASAEASRRTVREIADALRGRPARLVLVETWPRAPGHPLYREPGMPSDPEAMLAAVSRHVAALAAETGGAVAPAGTLWREAAERMPGLGLHAADGYHAAPAGAFLAALAILAALGADPMAGRWAPEGLDPALALRLRRVAAGLPG